MRILTLLPALLLSACSDDVCAYLGDYSGTFSGDASGALTVSITDGAEDGEAIATVTLEGDTFSAIGDGELHCEDGELQVTLLDDSGAEIGTFDGSMATGAGDWSLGTGETGTWAMAPAE